MSLTKPGQDALESGATAGMAAVTIGVSETMMSKLTTGKKCTNPQKGALEL